MGSFLKIKELLSNSEKFLIVGHEKPDGDSLGALLAVGETLENLGKKVDLISKDPYPETFKFLSGHEKIKNDFLVGGYDAIILLDNGDLRRTGFPERVLQAKALKIPIVNIDHHLKNDLWRIASINYADESYSSTCGLVYKIFKGLNFTITSSVATSLLTGIYTDTGGFQHTNTSAEVLDNVAELLKKGAKLKLISDNVSSSRSIARLKLWGVALDRLFINKEYGIVGTILTQEDIKKANASEDEVSGLVNLINATPESKIALLIYESSDGKIKGSLRTENNNVDVSKLAAFLGGGGHKKASGFSLEGQLKKKDGIWQVV